MRIVSALLVILSAAVLVGRWTLASAYRQTAREVCDLVDANYYRHAEPVVTKFVERCRYSADHQSFLLSKRANVDRLNAWLETLNVSHLRLNPPAEYRSIWENRAVDTGLRTRIVESDMVVIRVLKGSAADRAGIRVGDVLDAINGESVSVSMEAQSGTGRFAFSRRGQRFVVEIEPTDISEDLQPTLIDLGVRRKTGVLRIASFLPRYFEKQSWLPLAERLPQYSHVIIDLRDNIGGSFPGMLRALSPFRCRDPFVGTLLGAGDGGAIELRDVLDTRSQLEQLSETKELRLQAFKGYGCFNGDVTVLIDNGTSSTAEIFAEAFYTRKSSRVWGQPSAGQVVMAQWFEVRGFGDGTALAIPIAGYVSSDGQTIENAGLKPERRLSYELQDAHQGIDTWIREASHSETR